MKPTDLLYGKYRNLILATAMFNLGFVIWFSFAPFTGGIAEEFGLSVQQLGVVASAAIVAVPLGRIVIGPLTDRFGANVTGGVTLVVVGTFAIISAFSQTYEVFTASRIVASLSGITFVIGIQHVAEWFEEENLGTAEGIFAGIGNAGAGLGAYFTLPRIFGEGYVDPIFGSAFLATSSNWRAAFFYTGALAVLLGVVYYVFGAAAKSEAKREATKAGVSWEQWRFIATRYGAVVLSVAYVMSFGLELAMNGWLGTYYREAFGQGDIVIAASFAATFSVAAGLLRPIGGYVSDVVARNERDILPVFEGEYRNQWTFAALSFVVLSMFGMTLAGLTGNIYVAVVAGFLVGTGCAFSEGAIFAQVPAMFPDNSGSVAGIVGGIGTVGGVVYPLAFSAAFLPNLHVGYAIVGASMIPILGLVAWVFQPKIAERANDDGWFVSGERIVATGDDD
ncbi:MFS transporter [Halorubrum lacusprofundi]|uniref:Major facilitator superfamily MFS_1 n=1 Tax=Halorubrum lacusprofundi (strain ATCC 49239 / DSM 5036 / JCM 8891 / ACAM 34) TaxID=416348 RepID=B9LNQ4_HALLT|nr:MFS transporter [Halorubrum lacusprofundi]ACM56992.1 major facilitator superfamily MFS_1 [Halorubrum lacusprofundi ATCC 49239]MCG1006627.1 MFS transporter [Halorubrum lacusprofundi]